MRQAIEEGFILDPLRNYVTYKTYWKLANENPDEREVDPAKATSLLARFALTHDSTVAQHAEVIVEHFRAHTARPPRGPGQGDVVTAFRHNAVQMARSIKKYIGDPQLPEPWCPGGVLWHAHLRRRGDHRVEGERRVAGVRAAQGFRLHPR